MAPITSQNVPPHEAPGLGSPLPYFLAALACTALESIPAFDRYMQAPFFSQGAWLISKAFHESYKLPLYTGPKILIGITGGAFLLVFLAALRSPGSTRLRAWKQPGLLVFLSICLVPALVALGKAVSGVHSPVDILPYGGEYPYISVLEHLRLHGQSAGGQSFPAGHASGGFALMALYYLPLAQGYKKALCGAGFCAGWLMGLYQIARGEHFMSHTLTTMFLALAIITFLARRLSLPHR